MNDRKIKHNINIVVTTRHGDAIGQSFPLIEVLPNHCNGRCVAESKAKTCGGWIKDMELSKTWHLLPNLI